MKRSLFAVFLIFVSFVLIAEAQKRRPLVPSKKPVVNQPIQRMRTGRILAISGAKQADSLTFYRVIVPPDNYGWVQAEAVVGKFRRGDDERLVRLVQASEGFEQIEGAMIFLDNFPASPLRPPILLLTGDLIEENERNPSLVFLYKIAG